MKGRELRAFLGKRDGPQCRWCHRLTYDPAEVGELADIPADQPFTKHRRPYGPGCVPGGHGRGPTQPPIVMVVSSRAKRAMRSLIKGSQGQVFGALNEQVHRNYVKGERMVTSVNIHRDEVVSADRRHLMAVPAADRCEALGFAAMTTMTSPDAAGRSVGHAVEAGGGLRNVEAALGVGRGLLRDGANLAVGTGRRHLLVGDIGLRVEIRVRDDLGAVGLGEGPRLLDVTCESRWSDR